jgi:hypothetical protein
MRNLTVSCVVLVTLALLMNGCGSGGSTPALPAPSADALAKATADVRAFAGAIREAKAKHTGPEKLRVAEPKGVDTCAALNVLRTPAAAAAVDDLAVVLGLSCDGDVDGFLAAQTLYCIGSPEAQKILRENLLTPSYSATQSIRYSFCYEMPEPHRSKFIREYHLTTLSKDLKVSLTANPPSGRKEIRFRAALQNVSDRPFAISKESVYLGRHLHLEDSLGLFHGSETTVEYNMGPDEWVLLRPQERHTFDFTASVAPPQADRRMRRVIQDAQLSFETKDVAFNIAKSGKYRAWILFEAAPATDEIKRLIRDSHKGNPEELAKEYLDQRWSGRVVSEPIDIEIPAP